MSEDKLVTFISGYFSIILALGLSEFIKTQFISPPSGGMSLLSGGMSLLNLVNIISFVSVYLWIISYWIVYHRLTSISPYKNTAIFFFDAASFTILLFILIISFHVADLSSKSYDYNIILLFISLFAVLHIIGGALWYAISFKQEAIKKLKLTTYSLLHFGWAAVFLGIMAIIVQLNIKESALYFALGMVFAFIIIRFVTFRTGNIDQLLILERRPVDKGKEYNEPAGPYSDEFITEILVDELKYKRDKNTGKVVCDCYWYHVRVRNMHSTKPAINCVVHLEKWYKIIGYEKDDFKKVEVIKDFLYDVEFKWVGVSDKQILIEPNEFRDFDGFCVCKTNNEEASHKIDGFLGINQKSVDNKNVRKAYIVEPGHYELIFTIYSLNMRYEKSSFILHFPDNENIDKVIFHKIENKQRKNDVMLTHRYHEPPLVCTRCFELKQKCSSK
jgi:hypothetical protein